MLILRLKQAETAIADNRLDEAFEIVQSENIRQHRRGQKLIGRLARAFARRGQENLETERIQLALLDCNKAEKLAGNTLEVAKLRSAICAEMEQRRLRDRHRSFKVAQAKQHIQDGWLSAGEQILDGTDDQDSQAGIVRQQAEVVRLQIGQAISKVEQALGRNDLDSAIEIALKAGIAGNQNHEIVELVSKLRAMAVKQIRENLNEGRMNLAQSFWQKVSPIADGSGEISELGRVLAQCRQAAEHIAAGRPREAVPLLRKATSVCPSAQWLATLADQTRQAADLLDELAASPIADDRRWTMDDGRQAMRESDSQLSEEQPKAMGYKGSDVSKGSLPSKFVLQVDGIGSFIVLRDGRVTIGPISSSAHPTVGLMADPNLPVATIERAEDDYFIRSASPVRVNDTTTTNKLLANGDRIGLSPRCGMRFMIPNPASATAMLNLSTAQLGRADVRQIILMDRDILIGPNAGSHIHAESLEETIALYVKNGRLLCKANQAILVEDKPVSATSGLLIEKPIRIGRMSMVLTELKE
ncbi:MAG: hypothetical protein JXM79_15960 [Sedimentisphaerales bacterium]|nr:hypothetical protein [Sedimentisphaerales bacterium]